MTQTRIADIAAAYDAGRSWTGLLRRGGPILTAGQWFDMSYASGIPGGNYYASAPLVSAVFGEFDGVYLGPACNAAGYTKYLQKAMFIPPATSIGQATISLNDIVMYYPFVDGDGGLQTMTNSLPIPRYGGVGCKLMLVSQGAGYGVSPNTIIGYTNSNGVAGRIAQVSYTNNIASAGALVSSATDATAMTVTGGSPYIELQQGDTGIMQVDSVNMQTAVGGVFAVCIVKPLATFGLQEATTIIEVDFVRERLRPISVQDGAYLGMILRSNTTATPATIHAEFSLYWI